jgi:hypothetical protein
VMSCALFLAASCDDWSFWDNVFKRSSVGTSRGWTGGDGGYSVPLPGSGNRTLWLLGDSWVTGWDTSTGMRINSGPQALGDLSFGTNIGYQTNTRNVDPSTIRFWARNASTQVATDITTGQRGPLFSGYFSSASVNSTLSDTRVWPGGGYSPSVDDPTSTDTRVLLGFFEWSPSGCSNPPFCIGGIQLHNAYVGTIANTSGDPGGTGSTGTNPWKLTPSPALPLGILWGQAFLLDQGTYYIYGIRYNPGTRLTWDLVVAKATTAAAVTTPSSWRYLTTTGWVTGFPTSNTSVYQAVARDVGHLVTVQKVVRTGCSTTPGDSCTRYVLSHDHSAPDRTGRDHFAYFRISDNPTSWPAISAATPRLDLLSIDRTARKDAEDADASTPCARSLDGVKVDYGTCGTTYHVLGHKDLSTSDANGISSYVFSYVVPWGGVNQTTGAQHSDFYRPKFAFVPLSTLKPWCTVSGVACWEGSLFSYPSATLTQGQTEVKVFDPGSTSSHTFRAQFVNGSGNPDLYVSIGAPPTFTASDLCHSTASGATDACSVSLLNHGNHAVFVGVRGNAASSTYSLAVNYVD